MKYKNNFERYEYKYLLTKAQYNALLPVIQKNMVPDSFGKSTIRNIYFDTDNFRLIRRSVEKPIYKEKLRLRSYCRADEDTIVFAELKKKYNSVVYKRRECIPLSDAMPWLCEGTPLLNRSQIGSEINYFLQFYKTLKPMVFLAYDREAFFSDSLSDFRVTFDKNIRFRTENLTLNSEPYGRSLLDDDTILMEIKCAGGIPLWMTNTLTSLRIYRTSFSKYGTVYTQYIFPKDKENHYAEFTF